MSMHKVCPKCKKCNVITETAFPAARITTMEMVEVYDKNNK